MFNAVIISVLVLVVLSLLRVNVILSLIAAALVAGLVSGMSLVDTTELLVSGMGGQAETSLSYILLGVFAVMIGYSGITGFLVKNLIGLMKGKKALLLLTIAAVASLSQNVVPVHIAFIPILIPPLLQLFDKMKLNRRGVAVSLTFGLKAPYMMIPAGFGLIFHGVIVDGMNDNGMAIGYADIPLAMLIPGLGMVAGLLFAIFVTYRKDKEPKSADAFNQEIAAGANEDLIFTKFHLLTIIAIIVALVVQIVSDSLILGALSGIVLMFLFQVVSFRSGDEIVNEGIRMMGMIAFVMLIASGYATVLEDTGAIDRLVASTAEILGDNMFMGALLMLSVGMIVTLGIGTSFGTIPILATLFVPLSIAMGFSPLATAALIGTAGAIGDAGSPSSDSTLGPTAGLGADGNHNHIWDTCVPTFLHFNIPLFIFGLAAAMIL
ncbi:sodium:proton antiporter [Salicibibacter cibi]|uniref:Sodium:proton antiporter n=1 Tax=Salicibibacter cibi TaxID=2743001 RepID=A0A7T6Z991_9BACI|nr:Na+/H+ antiporter NhaC family protein [Salicibibacter cibi]QQK79276.1 sodium:proton antiporter [Salicibibacter cibi]